MMRVSYMTARQAATLMRLLEQIEVPRARIHRETTITNPDDCYITVDDATPAEVTAMAQYIKFMDQDPTRAMILALSAWRERAEQ